MRAAARSGGTTNYQLYRDRDTIITNRLTQRQSVNVLLMKETRKTILARLSEPQVIYFENLDNDGQKELLMNEWWKHVAERSRLEVLNEIDKKQEKTSASSGLQAARTRPQPATDAKRRTRF